MPEILLGAGRLVKVKNLSRRTPLKRSEFFSRCFDRLSTRAFSTAMDALAQSLNGTNEREKFVMMNSP